MVHTTPRFPGDCPEIVLLYVTIMTEACPLYAVAVKLGDYFAIPLPVLYKALIILELID